MVPIVALALQDGRCPTTALRASSMILVQTPPALTCVYQLVPTTNATVHPGTG